MITSSDIYHVMTAVVPLYVAMILAYGSVKWWRIFSPEQCSGINRFVALFAVPLLSFHFISANNPYTMNLRFLAADTLQKLMVLAALVVWARLLPCGGARRLDWCITLFSVSTLPNTLVMGIPLLKGMYGEASGSLMVQIVVLQCIIWYTLMLFLFEYRAARILIAEQFPATAGSIASIHVDADVVSLDGRRDALETETQVKEDGKLRVTVRRSNASKSDVYSRRSHGISGATPRPSNLTNAEIYSLQSSRNPTPRGSSFNHTDFYSMVGGRSSNFAPGDAYDIMGQPHYSTTPRPSNFEDETNASSKPTRFSYQIPPPAAPPRVAPKNKLNGQAHLLKPDDGGGGKDLHMFVWSSSASPVSEVFGNSHGNGQDYSIPPPPQPSGNIKETIIPVSPNKAETGEEFSFGERGGEGEGDGDGENGRHDEEDGGGKKGRGLSTEMTMPPASVMTRLILIMVWRKLLRNPNTYSSVIGIGWALVSYKWHVKMPDIVAHSISILSDAGLGMAMFSLGLFMALQPRIIACGYKKAFTTMAMRFFAGPAVMVTAAVAVGLRGVLLHIAIVQAALPQGIVPFVFAKEYSVHPDILSTGVIFGMLIALPITLAYYFFLGL